MAIRTEENTAPASSWANDHDKNYLPDSEISSLALDDDLRQLFMSHWMVACVKSNQERALAEQLHLSLGIKYYLPLQRRQLEAPITTWRNSEDKRDCIPDKKPGKFVLQPILPGFIFIYGTIADKYNVLNTKKAWMFVKVRNQVELVRDLRELANVTDKLNAFYEPTQLLEAHKFQPGDQVVVTSGPFEGTTGVLLEQPGKKPRVQLKVSSLLASSFEVEWKAIKLVARNDNNCKIG